MHHHLHFRVRKCPKVHLAIGGDIITNAIKDNQVTIGYDKISGEYIYENGQESLLILALLSRHFTIRNEVVFNLKYLFGMLSIPVNKQDRKNRVIQSINNIFEANIDLNTNINQIITLPYILSPNQYLIVKDSEVDTILSYNRRVDKYSLFNTYVAIKRHVNYYTGTAYPSIRTLMDITNVVSNNTTMKYIELLEHLRLIKCERGGYIVTDESIRRPNNTYTIL